MLLSDKILLEEFCNGLLDDKCPKDNFEHIFPHDSRV